jgi:hypothetical protein
MSGLTLTGPATRARQASLIAGPARNNAAASSGSGGTNVPSSTFTQHEPHAARPPHVAAMFTPTLRAASSTVVPIGTRVTAPDG